MARPIPYAAADSTPAPAVKEDTSPPPTVSKSGTPNGESFLLIAAVALSLTYFLPTTIALVRGHFSTFAIFLVNLIFGWTFVGWCVALIWSFTGNTRNNQRFMARAIAAETNRERLASK